MPRTSRTARAPRVASAACAMAPSLLGLPLLVAAFLATLWLFGASPVHADALGGTLTGAVAETGAGALTGAGPESPESTGAEAPEEARTLRLDRPGSLGEVVPRQVAEPVAQTLDTVGQGLGQRGGDGSALLGEAGWPVDEVREGARRVVADLDRTRRDTAQNLLLPAVDTAAGLPVSLAPEARSDEGAPATADERRERRGREDAPSSAAEGASGADAPLHVFGQSAGPALAAPAPEEAEAPGEADVAAPAAHANQVAAGSAASASGSAPAPAVAGYLTASPVTAPAPIAVLLASRSLHPVPSGPSGDPTVSPD